MATPPAASISIARRAQSPEPDMRLRLWPRRTPAEAASEEPAVEAHPEPPPQPAAVAEPAPTMPQAELPARLSLTLDEAKAAIRGAKGDVIQVGFLAAEYKRHQSEDPESAETRAARAHLCDLIATRLRDRKLLAPDGTFELREGV
jgi:hypothetical protein